MSKAKESEPITGGEISRRELLKMASPLGKVELDSAKCSGCGLCAVDCPTEALTIAADAEKGTYQLLFQHSVCIACNKCIEVCPVDACVPDESHKESREQLLEKWKKLHPGETPTVT